MICFVLNISWQLCIRKQQKSCSSREKWAETRTQQQGRHEQVPCLQGARMQSRRSRSGSGPATLLKIRYSPLINQHFCNDETGLSSSQEAKLLDLCQGQDRQSIRSSTDVAAAQLWYEWPAEHCSKASGESSSQGKRGACSFFYLSSTEPLTAKDLILVSVRPF